MKILPCVIGLGYVGLPIFIKLKNSFETYGFDTSVKRIKELNNSFDNQFQFLKDDLINKNKKHNFTNSLEHISKCNFFIICVPTPIYKNKKPDLRSLKRACKNIAKILKKNDIIIFESTVYPGVTEKICIPIILKNSKIKKKDFYVGYSPERINPGDKSRTLNKINKIIAFEYQKEKKTVEKVYKKISKKLFFTKSIMEAETAKVIENIQRDINIGLFNEIFIFSNKFNLSFKNIIQLASTKWNFLKFKPGLVGGHCLPVDPYYFSYAAKQKKIDTKITLAGREINNYMENYTYKIIKQRILLENKNSKVLFLGGTYKANVADKRNSLSLAIYNKLKKQKFKIDLFDPYINKIKTLNINNYDIFVVMVGHDKIINMIKSRKISDEKIIDIFGILK